MTASTGKSSLMFERFKNLLSRGSRFHEDLLPVQNQLNQSFDEFRVPLHSNRSITSALKFRIEKMLSLCHRLGTPSSSPFKSMSVLNLVPPGIIVVESKTYPTPVEAPNEFQHIPHQYVLTLHATQRKLLM